MDRMRFGVDILARAAVLGALGTVGVSVYTDPISARMTRSERAEFNVLAKKVDSTSEALGEAILEHSVITDKLESLDERAQAVEELIGRIGGRLEMFLVAMGLAWAGIKWLEQRPGLRKALIGQSAEDKHHRKQLEEAILAAMAKRRSTDNGGES